MAEVCHDIANKSVKSSSVANLLSRDSEYFVSACKKHVSLDGVPRSVLPRFMIVMTVVFHYNHLLRPADVALEVAAAGYAPFFRTKVYSIIELGLW